jgi:hypothetical protein
MEDELGGWWLVVSAMKGIHRAYVQIPFVGLF